MELVKKYDNVVILRSFSKVCAPVSARGHESFCGTGLTLGPGLMFVAAHVLGARVQASDD